MSTNLDMIASGQWAKVGKKHYRHASGIEITYNCNKYGWQVSTKPQWLWKTLWVARYEAEKDAAK